MDGEGPPYLEESSAGDNFNGPQRLKALRDHIDKTIAQTNQTFILLPFGCNNAYSEPAINFDLMDTLISEFNQVASKIDGYHVKMAYS